MSDDRDVMVNRMTSDMIFVLRGIVEAFPALGGLRERVAQIEQQYADLLDLPAPQPEVVPEPAKDEPKADASKKK